MSRSYSLGFTTQCNEIDFDLLPVTGQFPPWLSGTLIRNGPAQFEVGDEAYRHWFDGLAMLHRFSFREGTVSYSNRYLRSNTFKMAAESGRIVCSEFATDPRQSFVSRLWSLFFPKPADNACVNVSMIGGSHVAMTETVRRIQFDPDSLETVGTHQYSDKLPGQFTTAHPHYDFERHELVNFVTHFSGKSKYHVYRIKDGDRRRDLLASVPVSEPGYIHSFGLTDKYVMLVEFPLLVSPLDLFLRRKPFIENFKWRPERGCRFIVVHRHGDGIPGVYEADPLFAFHHINAFEDGDDIIVDMAVYEDKSVIDALYLDRLRDATEPVPTAVPYRYRVATDRKSLTGEPISDLPIELPRINYRVCNKRRHQFVYGISRKGPAVGLYNGLVKIDLRAGKSAEWSNEDCYPGEPVFVPSPDETFEDEGAVLSVVLDAKTERSFLVILDGQAFVEVARADLPQHVPFGFHGQFYSDDFAEDRSPAHS
jgi:carotenoid cleavage dioxygenase-like enzyme